MTEVSAPAARSRPAIVAPAEDAPLVYTPPPPRARPTGTSPLERGELASALTSISKVHGAAVVTRGDMRPKFRHIPTGIFSLDISLLGGLPQGCATLGYGWEHSGKTTMGLKAIAQAQRKFPNEAPVLVDIEGTYSPEWGEVQGVDNSRLVLVQPESGEQAMDIALAMMKAREVSMLMIDSLAGLTTKAMLDKSFEDATVGEQARMISRFCAVGQTVLNQQRNRGHRPCVYLVNQWRTKIGVTRGDPRVLPGGIAQNYWASVKIEFKNKEEAGRDLQGHQLIDHNDHSFNIKKNKIGIAPREGEFLMVRNPDHPLGQGFVDDARAVVTWAKSVGATSGGGTNQRIRGCDRRFGNLQDIADHMYDDLDFFDWTKRTLIEDYREKNGLERNFL